MRAGFDTPESTAGKAQNIKDAGYSAVIRYLSPNTHNFPTKRITKSEAEELLDAGIALGFVWENGYPISPEYFNADQGEADANGAIAAYRALGLTWAKPVIFYAVDYDATEDDLNGPILEYFMQVHAKMDEAGYLVGVYGSGMTARILINYGYVHYDWLAQSTGFAEYEKAKITANIVQLPDDMVCGLEVDEDHVMDDDVILVP